MSNTNINNINNIEETTKINGKNNEDNKKDISNNKEMDKEHTSKVIKDFGYIKIGEKFYEVNQNKASLNVIKGSLTLSNFFREYECIVKTIEVYNNAKDALLVKGYNENFEADIEKFENSIVKEKSKFNSLLENTEVSLNALLIFYLGKEVINGELSDLSFIDRIKICMELSAQVVNENTNALGRGNIKSRASKLGA